MRYWWGCILLIVVTVVGAQSANCPALEQAAINQAERACSDVDTGFACHGSPIVDAELSDVTLSLDAVEDTAPLESVESLATRANEDTWGVGLIRTVAYPLDSWEPNDVTLVVMGDAEVIQDEREALGLNTLTTTVTAGAGANVRQGPGTDYGVITPLSDGAYVKLTGRVGDNSWLRVQLPDGRTGWIGSGALPEVAYSELPRVTVSSPKPTLLFSLYSIFDLDTGSLDNRCAEAPESGVLLQTESVVTPLRFRVNARDIIIGGTVFLQGTPDDQMTVYVLEGQAQVDETVADAGGAITVPLELTGTDEPLPPASQIAYDYDRMRSLPTQEILPRRVYVGLALETIITPAPDEDISPIADVLVDDPCVITVGPGGANLRAGPGTDFAIRGVMDFRETALPEARTTTASDGTWWKLAQNLWISAATTVTGGDCVSVPPAELIPALPPEPAATPTAAG